MFPLSVDQTYTPKQPGTSVTSNMSHLTILATIFLFLYHFSHPTLGLESPGFWSHEPSHHDNSQQDNWNAFFSPSSSHSPHTPSPKLGGVSGGGGGAWDMLKWQGYFLTQCLETSRSGGDSCPMRERRFSEVAWYRNQTEACADPGDRNTPFCDPPGDWGHIGNRADVRWEAQPGELVRAPFSNSWPGGLPSVYWTGYPGG
jgi:hypothetical protein